MYFTGSTRTSSSSSAGISKIGNLLSLVRPSLPERTIAPKAHPESGEAGGSQLIQCATPPRLGVGLLRAVLLDKVFRRVKQDGISISSQQA
jgi:hypothetical protein